MTKNIKFNGTFSQINQFYRLTSLVENDVFLKHGRTCVDAKSLMGIYSMPLAEDMELEIIEKNKDEVAEYLRQLEKIGL